MAERITKTVVEDCDASKTLNFNEADAATTGYILSCLFTKSGKALDADIQVSDPENPESNIKAVMILDHVTWNGGPTDPIEIEGRVSPANRGTLLESLSTRAGGADLEASWVVKCYDYQNKQYFQRFHTDGKNIKLIITQGTEVFIANKPDNYVSQPLNYKVRMSLTPKNDGEDQVLGVATSTQKKFNLPVGVSVKA